MSREKLSNFKSKQKTRKKPLALQLHKKQSNIYNFFHFCRKVLFGFIFALTLFVIMLAYSQHFRQFFLKKITSTVNNFLIADLELEDIHVLGLHGISLQHLRLITSGDTLAYIPEIEININFENIFLGEININYLKLSSPRIKLLRSNTDSTWNYQWISASDSSNSSSEPSNLKFKINELIINNAYFAMWDSTANWQPHGYINFNKLLVDNLDISLKNTNINLNTMSFKTNLAYLSAIEKISGFEINKLACNINLDTNGIILENSKIELPNAELNFDANLLNFNVFNEPDIAIANMQLKLVGNNINPEFIDNFSKLPVEIGYINLLEAEINGTLSNMNIQKIIVDASNSHIEYTNGKLTNLLASEHLTYSGDFRNTRIYRKDFADILKNINLSNIPDFGRATIDHVYFWGSIDSVYANLDVKSNIGNISGVAGVGFGKPIFSYDTDLKIRNLNLENILKKTVIASRLNTDIKLKGSGIKTGKIFSSLDIEILNSQIDKYYLDNSSISLLASGDTVLINKFEIVQINPPVWNYKIDNLNNFLFGGTDIALSNISNTLEKSSVSISGGVGIADFSNLHFVLEASLNNINLQEFTDNSELPNSISGDINLNIVGTEIDNLFGDFNINLPQINFTHKSMLPVNISGNISQTNSLHKRIEININSLYSNILYCLLEGEYSMTSLISNASKHIDGISHFFSNKIKHALEHFNPEQDTSVLAKNFSFEPASINITLKSRDLDFINMFLPEFNSNSARIDAQLFYDSSEFESNLSVDSLNIKNLSINYDENIFKIDNLHVYGSTGLTTVDSITSITNLQINIPESQKISINNTTLDSMKLTTSYSNEKLNLNLSGIYNSILKTNLNSTITINSENLELVTKSLELHYKNNLWHSKSPIQAGLSHAGLNISSCEITRDSKETLKLSGTITNNGINNLSLKLYNFELNDLNFLLNNNSVNDSISSSHSNFSKINKNEKLDLFARLDSLQLFANGDFSDPKIELNFFIDKIRYKNQTLGKITAMINYADTNITGSAKMLDNKNKNLLNININSIPILLGLNKNDKNETVFLNYKKDASIDIRVETDKLPAQIVSPFVPAVDNLDGFLTANVSIAGELLEKISYTGNLQLDNFSLRVIATNVRYITSGNINIKTDEIYFDNLKIRNATTDLRNGEALTTGKIKLEDFQIKHIDFSLRSKMFLVLSDATASSMPWFYGRMVIATEDENTPIRFYGTLSEPNLTGSVTILESDMKMPNILDNSTIIKKTNFHYINKDTMRISVVSYRDTASSASSNLSNFNLTNNNSKKQNSTDDFAELLNIDLFVKIKRLNIMLDLGGIGHIFARVGTSDPTVPVHYTKLRTHSEAKITGGNIEVLEGSTVQIMRTMAATGTISFPTSRISQPSLDLTAEYKGKMLDKSNNYNQFSVFLKITGVANRPTLNFSYFINGVEATGDSKQIEENSIILLTTGKLKGYNEEISSSIVNEGASMLASQFASKTLTDLLIKTGVVQSANLQFEGESFNSAEVKISGNIGGVATWTIGGKIDDIASSYNISIDIPIAVKVDGINNLILQLSKSTDLETVTFDKSAKLWETKLKLGGSW